MSSMNISLSENMKEWVEERITGGAYHNSSEYIRDLIRKDQEELARARAFAAAIEMGRQSGTDGREFAQIIKDAKEKIVK